MMMSKLFRSNSTSSLASRSTSLLEISQETGINNSEEYELSDVDLKLEEWNFPKIPTKEFYKSSWNLKTAFKTDFHIPRTLKWFEVSFPESWKLENENFPLQIQNPYQDSDLDFIQQLADGSVRISFDKSRFRSPLDDYRPRSPIDLRRSRLPNRQPPILLGDRPASHANSSRPFALYPRSRRDLSANFQGVTTRSQVSTPCYTAKQDSVINQDDDNSQKVESPLGTNMEDPYQNFDLKVLKKDFKPDMKFLGDEFDLEKNQVKREAYRANHTKEQKLEVFNAWQEFMKVVSDNIPFFEYF
ncbi:hypothetical protein SO802_015938 [Lithocarpus litseifolius]|uniref:DUF7588 domain-containing protein n=1 Tax=Lithocarpus litseifolius TaxID=425828 RepID=A0AAW2CVP0_9ROSI